MKKMPYCLLVMVYSATLVAQGASPAKAPRAGTASAANSPQTVAPATGVLRPSPTPTQPANPGLASAPIGAPQYSPKALDFGTVPEGQSAKRTLTLTPPGGGTVSLSIPKGHFFWLAEYREMGPLTFGSKNSPSVVQKNSLQTQVRARTTYQFGQSPDNIQWTVSAGSTVQLDLMFQPQVNALLNTSAISVSIQLSGVAALHSWSVYVPACGIGYVKPRSPFQDPNPPGQTCPHFQQ